MSQDELASKFNSFEEMLENVSILDDHHADATLGEVSQMDDEVRVPALLTTFPLES